MKNIDDWINQKIGSMSLRERIGQTSQELLVQAPLNDPKKLEDYMNRYPVGSFFVGQDVIKSEGTKSDQIKEQVDKVQNLSNLPLSIAGDLENGVGSAVPSLTTFPNLMALGASESESLAYEYGMWTAKEATSVGYNWLFGPVVDLAINWLNPIVGTRALGESPDKIIPLLRQLIRGYQENGLSATAKHFPGDGIDFRDQHLSVGANSLNEEQWLETYGKVYQECFKTEVHSIMAGHIALPCFDNERASGNRPKPATVSHKLLTGLLRDRLDFDGVVVSDALIMAGFTAWSSYEKRTIEAFNAGIDVMLWPGLDYFDIMERAINEERVTEERLNESVARILKMKWRQGLLKNEPELSTNKEEKSSHINLTSNPVNFSETLAQSSLTLVRNEENILPLDPNKIKKVLIILGTPNADSGEKMLTPFIDFINKHGIEHELIINGNCMDIAKKESEGKQFDALVSFFDLSTHALKNTMRPTGAMAEPMWTIQNTETMEPIIISLGSPYLLNDMPFAHTLVNAYSSCEANLKAVAEAIFGKSDFPGKTPVETGGDWIPKELAIQLESKLKTI